MSKRGADSTSTDSADSIPSAAMSAPDWFDDRAYLEANPDVAAAVACGDLGSGYEHYLLTGAKEKRALSPDGREPYGRLMLIGQADVVTAHQALTSSIDSLLCSNSGAIMIVGWVSDEISPISSVRLRGVGWSYTFDAVSLLRVRRPDVEAALGSGLTHSYGFVGFAFTGVSFEISGPCEVVMTAGKATATHVSIPRQVDDLQLRELSLGHIAHLQFFGNRQIEAIGSIGVSVGGELVKHNMHITCSLTRKA